MDLWPENIAAFFVFSRWLLVVSRCFSNSGRNFPDFGRGGAFVQSAAMLTNS